MWNDNNIEANAARFAYIAHGNQIRKYTGEPYIRHPAAVAQILKTLTDDPEWIASAWLHDTVEDTKATIRDIYRLFGSRVARIVSEVTDVSKPSDGNRAARKLIDRNHLACASWEGMNLKLCDIIHNTSSIVEHDLNFAKIYLYEIEQVLNVLTNTDATLFHRASTSLIDGKLKLLEDKINVCEPIPCGIYVRNGFVNFKK